MKIWRWLQVAAVLIFLFCAVCLSACASGAASEKPPSPFVDAGACPFECCTYRQWTVRDRVELVDRPNGTRVVGTLRKGDAVQGLTGQVISTPVEAKAEQDIPATPIKSGDTFYILHYHGEGFWAVWLRGNILQVEEPYLKPPWPKAEWWVQVKSGDGVTGWTLSEKHFLHQDACE